MICVVACSWSVWQPPRLTERQLHGRVLCWPVQRCRIPVLLDMSHRHVRVIDGIWQLQPRVQCCPRLVSAAMLSIACSIRVADGLEEFSVMEVEREATVDNNLGVFMCCTLCLGTAAWA